MTFKIKTFLILFCFVISACHEEQFYKLAEDAPKDRDPINYIENRMTVKLQNEVLKSIDGSVNELVVPTGSHALDDYLKVVGGYKLKRVFPNAGKREAMQCQEGLHLWYTVWLDQSKSVTLSRSLGEANYEDVIAFIEPVFEPIQGTYQMEGVSSIAASNGETSPANVAPFNDPLFAKQWNLYNSGRVGNYTADGKKIVSSIAGADINVVPAWEEQTGDPRVIVSIVDGGIDVYHEDLINNLWINENEIPGNGIDDDNNGYIDDIHGYNFVDENGVIIPNDHGTHVAGIIAAQNNNGIGISGIAGGDGRANTGIRVMSSQIFKSNPNYDPNDPTSPRSISTRSTNHTAAAIVYGANNGAVISQNSWGYDVGVQTPQVIKEAIRYFNKYAGSKAEGDAPMKGGVVVFAASNDYTEFKTYPAAEEDVIAVAAYAPDFSAAWYTNYGSWVDIAAPGGSSPVFKKFPYENGEMTSQILSTVASKNGESRYGYMQGTSMAAPHITGLAGLIISKYGGADFTNKDLKQRLLTSVKGENTDRYNLPKYYGKMGKGFADAVIALEPYDTSAIPGLPLFEDSFFKSSYDYIRLVWRAEPFSGQKELNIDRYNLYISKERITNKNYTEEYVAKIEIPANFTDSKSIMTQTLTNLQSGTKYYFALKSFARNGNSSNLVIYSEEVHTLANTAPNITSNIDLDKPLIMAGNEVKEVVFKIEDAENHAYTYSITNSNRLSVEHNEGELRLRIFANKYYKGDYEVVLTVTDEYGAVSSKQFYFRVNLKKPPRLKNRELSFNIPVGKQQRFNMRDIIEDSESEYLKFELLEPSNSHISASLEHGYLLISATRVGSTNIGVMVEDKYAQKVRIDIPVFSYENEGIYALFPTIAVKNLYIKLGDIIEGKIRVRIRDLMGRVVREEFHDTTELDAHKKTIILNIYSLAPGQYQLSIANKGEVYKDKFLKK